VTSSENFSDKGMPKYAFYLSFSFFEILNSVELQILFKECK